MKGQSLQALNEYLFTSLDALSDDTLTEEKLEMEIKRSEAIQKIAKTVIDNANTVLTAKKHADEYGYGQGISITPLIGDEQGA